MHLPYGGCKLNVTLSLCVLATRFAQPSGNHNRITQTFIWKFKKLTFDILVFFKKKNQEILTHEIPTSLVSGHHYILPSNTAILKVK